MIKLFWCPRTRASRAVWLLEETGLDYEVVPVDVRDPASKAAHPAFVAASPMGKVPALEDGPVAMADSAAIGLYIADRYPETRLAPSIDDPARGRYLYWMTFVPGALEPAIGEKFSGTQPNRVSHGWGDFDSMIQTLEDGLEPGPWLLGERFTAADVLVGSGVCFLRLIGVLPDSAVLHDYADRCEVRPAYQKAQSLEQTPEASAAGSA